MITSTLEYLAHKFELAVFDLATGEGDARSRIKAAYGRFWTIRLEDYPPSLRKNREEITTILTRLEGREGYIIPDNLRKMKNKTASKVAALILDIWLELQVIKNKEKACKNKE